MLGQGLDVLGADELVVVWGPDVCDVPKQSAAEPAVITFGRSSTGGGGNPEQEKDYTYRQGSGWASLDPRPGRRVYSAIPRKSQWSPDKESRNYAAASKQASERNMNRHRKVKGGR